MMQYLRSKDQQNGGETETLCACWYIFQSKETLVITSMSTYCLPQGHPYIKLHALAIFIVPREKESQYRKKNERRGQ